jgi:hypothetical protein
VVVVEVMAVVPAVVAVVVVVVVVNVQALEGIAFAYWHPSIVSQLM